LSKSSDLKVVSREIGNERLVRSEIVGGIVKENKGVGSVFHFVSQLCKGDCNCDVYHVNILLLWRFYGRAVPF